MGMFNPGVGYRHVQYLEGQLARTGRHELRRKILGLSIERRQRLNEELGKAFAGKNFGQVDAYIASQTSFGGVR
jgi:hypothetical protein